MFLNLPNEKKRGKIQMWIPVESYLDFAIVIRAFIVLSPLVEALKRSAAQFFPRAQFGSSSINILAVFHESNIAIRVFAFIYETKKPLFLTKMLTGMEHFERPPD